MSIKIGKANKPGTIVFHYGNPAFVKKVKEAKTETLYACKPFNLYVSFAKKKSVC